MRRTETALARWLEERLARWRRLDALAVQRDRRSADLAEVRELVASFRATVRDLSLAHGVMPGAKLTRQLEALVVRAHDVIYLPPARPRQRLIELLRDEVPQIVHELRGGIAFTVALFFACALAGYLLVAHYPELSALFASETMINKVQSGELWTRDLMSVTPPSLLSLSIMSNNIVVTLTAFVLGALYGLGTLYLISLNGAMLGGAFALTARYGLAGQLSQFILAHGVVELSVIFIATAAGLKLGGALIHPGPYSRREAFRLAAAKAGKLLPVCAVFLVGSGLIEGYISPDESYPLWARAAIGLSYGLLLWLVLSGRVWRRRRAGTD